MMKRTVRRHISRPAEEIMSALLDVKNWPKWRPGIDGIENVSDTPLQTGSAWTVERHLGDRRLRFLARSVELDPPHAFGYTASGDGIDVVIRWSIRQDDERVLVAQETSVRAVGLRNAISGAARKFLAQQNDALDDLRTVLQRRKPCARLERSS